MSDSGKDVVVTTGPAPPQKKGFKRHCARFWWIYLIVFILIAVLVPVLVIFVGVPRIAQDKLDDAELSIQGIQVSNPRAGSLTMSINSTILADDSVKATIDAFPGVMYLEDLPEHEPFAVINFPETKTAKVQTVNVTQDLEIKHLDALTTFNEWLIRNRTVRVTVEGDTKVRPKGLVNAFGVKFKKTVEIDGLDNFAGLSVLDATISITPDENGDNFVGFTNIPNRSFFTLEIGNATFATFFNDEQVGETQLDNMVLFPGDNNITMRAQIDQLPILRANSERPYCEGADFPFELTGINVTHTGDNLTYFGVALSRTTQQVDIPVGQILQRDLNITASCDEDEGDEGEPSR